MSHPKRFFPEKPHNPLIHWTEVKCAYSFEGELPNRAAQVLAKIGRSALDIFLGGPRQARHYRNCGPEVIQQLSDYFRANGFDWPVSEIQWDGKPSPTEAHRIELIDRKLAWHRRQTSPDVGRIKMLSDTRQKILASAQLRLGKFRSH
jgi:hypothetical protein